MKTVQLILFNKDVLKLKLFKFKSVYGCSDINNCNLSIYYWFVLLNTYLMVVLGVQVALAEENSNGSVTFFDDQMILTNETCVLDNITSKYKRLVPKMLSKVKV